MDDESFYEQEYERDDKDPREGELAQTQLMIQGFINELNGRLDLIEKRTTRLREWISTFSSMLVT